MARGWLGTWAAASRPPPSAASGHVRAMSAAAGAALGAAPDSHVEEEHQRFFEAIKHCNKMQNYLLLLEKEENVALLNEQ